MYNENNGILPQMNENDSTQQEQTVQPQVEVTQQDIIQPDMVEPQTIEPQTIEAQTIEPQTIEPQTVEPQTVEPQTIEAQTAEAQTIEAETAATSNAEETDTSYRFKKEDLDANTNYSYTKNVWQPDMDYANSTTSENDGKQSKKDIKRAKKEKKKEKKKGKGGFGGFVKFVGTAAAFGVIAFGAFLGAQYVSDKYFEQETTPVKVASTNVNTTNTSVTTTTTTATATGKTDGTGATVMDVSDIVSEVMPSIVAITSTQYIETGNYGYWWAYGNSESEQYEAEGAGSGIILAQSDTELLIVTNEHVVADADSLSVQFADGNSVEAYTKGTDVDADLAIVSIPLENISNETLSAIKIATLGDSDAVEVGDGAIAIGNALGYGQSVTTGVISATNREVSSDSDTTKVLLQTDAAINPGNSGGALLNMKGEVIGINELKYSSDDVEGMGFAIPITSASDIINDLMNQETRTKVEEGKQGYLGIAGVTVSSEASEVYGIPEGVKISSLEEDGAAEKAGLEEGDIIVKIDGKKVTSIEDLTGALEYYAEGDKATLTVKYADGREYKEKEVEVTLGKKPVSSSSSSQQKNGGSNSPYYNYGNGNNSGNDSGNDYYGNSDIFDYFGW